VSDTTLHDLVLKRLVADSTFEDQWTALSPPPRSARRNWPGSSSNGFNKERIDDR
jgi:hypothetical protein